MPGIRVRAAAGCAGLWLCLAPRWAGAQTPRPEQPAAGKFLVARRGIPDPNFAEAVILVVLADRNAAMGLIVNRSSRIPLARLFPGLKVKGRADRVYLGGPVGRTGVLALVRSKKKPEGARQVFGEVFFISDKRALEKAAAASTGAGAWRVYLGYAGWGGGQLERELKMGMWHVVEAEAALVFDPDPESVWERVIRRTETLKAEVGRGAGGKAITGGLAAYRTFTKDTIP